MSGFHLLFLGNPNNPSDIFGYLPQVDGLRISSFQSRTDKAISISRAPVRTICTDFNDLRETLQLVRAVHALDPFDGVMAIYELFTPLAAMIRDELGLCGVSRRSVQAARDKLLTREILTKAGLSRVPYAKVDSADELERFVREVDGRVVLKPINGVASRCIFFINDPSEVPQIWAQAQADLDDPEWLTVSREGKLVGYMAERFIGGAEYSVEAITHDRQTHVMAVVEKGLRGAIEAGHCVPPRSLAPEQVAAMADYIKGVLSAIEVDSGISHTELKWSSDGPEVVEINLRVAGDSIPKVVELAYGSDIILDYMQLMVHGKAPERRKNGSAGIRFFMPDDCQIDAIEHVEDAKAIPGVQSVMIGVAPGKVIHQIKSSRDRAGYVIAQAATHDEVQRSLDQAFATVKFVVSRGGVIDAQTA
ncbi:ATP-grasp domain-containing protein [Sorangium sp. So ce429]